MRYDKRTDKRFWRAGDFNLNKVYLRCNIYRVMYPEHGVVNMHVPCTDKAVRPTNVMGGNKRIGKVIVQTYNKMPDIEFVDVKFEKTKNSLIFIEKPRKLN